MSVARLEIIDRAVTTSEQSKELLRAYPARALRKKKAKSPAFIARSTASVCAGGLRGATSLGRLNDIPQ
jgi:hypothetical protein